MPLPLRAASSPRRVFFFFFFSSSFQTVCWYYDNLNGSNVGAIESSERVQAKKGNRRKSTDTFFLSSISLNRCIIIYYKLPFPFWLSLLFSYSLSRRDNSFSQSQSLCVLYRNSNNIEYNFFYFISPLCLYGASCAAGINVNKIVCGWVHHQHSAVQCSAIKRKIIYK